jgi:ribA/ribD-fused uncharacterized protein
MKAPGIYGFTGQFRWLSNFWNCSIKDTWGNTFSCVEAAYQACKIDRNEEGWEKQWELFSHMNASEAKAYGKKVKLRADWHEIKDTVMLRLLRQKFKNPSLATLLLNTKDLYLEETNTWGDKYWGVCNSIGENKLGKLLMQVRTELAKEITSVKS